MSNAPKRYPIPSTHGVDLLVAITQSAFYDGDDPTRMIPVESVTRSLRFTMPRSVGGVVARLVGQGLVSSDRRGMIGLTESGVVLVKKMDPDIRL